MSVKVIHDDVKHLSEFLRLTKLHTVHVVGGMKKSKPAHLQMVGARDPGYMDSADFYSTPPEATEALLRVEKFKNVLEPCCGDGAISEVLKAHGIAVTSLDLHDRGYGEYGHDFLVRTAPWKGDIVTNVPYNLALPFAQKAVEVATGKVCLLLRLAWLAGQRRKTFFKTHPPARVHVFSKRIPRMHRPDYEGPKSTSTIEFAWFVWTPRFRGPSRNSLALKIVVDRLKPTP